MTHKKIAVIIVLLAVGIVSHTYGEDPLVSLKKTMDQSLELLRDPEYQDDALKHEQKEKIWEQIQGIFDFSEISKRTLASNWKKFSPFEQEDFSLSFANLLGNAYIGRIQNGFQGEEITYVSKKVSGERAVIKTKIMRKDVEVPVDYSMFLRNGEWKIYDVRIEGVSLVQNYRGQFRSFLRKKTPAELIGQIKQKVAAQIK